MAKTLVHSILKDLTTGNVDSACETMLASNQVVKVCGQSRCNLHVFTVVMPQAEMTMNLGVWCNLTQLRGTNLSQSGGGHAPTTPMLPAGALLVHNLG